MTELLAPERAAELLSVSQQTLANWRVRGCGPRFFKVGRAVRYDRQDLAEWLLANRRRSTSEISAA
jgi:hypothetical protein